MQTIKIWSPHKRQLEVVNDQSRFKVIRCGRRFGKTIMETSYILEEALLNPDSLYFYIAPTYKQAKMIAWEMFQKHLRNVPKKLVLKVNESELYIVLANHAKISVKGADNPDSLRGVGLNGVVMDEYADMKPNVFKEIIRPALTDKKGWAHFIGTPKGFNHFYDLYQHASSEEGWAAFHFTSYDNPMLDRGEIESIKAEETEDTFAQEYMAEFRKMEGLVYKEFDRERHTYKDLPQEKQFIEVICGVDFGFTNPTAIMVIGKDFDNHYWIIDEVYKAGMNSSEIVEKLLNLKSRHHIDLFYPDPENPAYIKEIQDAGLPCRDVDKSVELGIDHVRKLFKSDRIHIGLHCENLIWELERYRYQTNRGDYNEKEKPIKKDDHGCDALRYPLFMNQPTDIREEVDYNFNLYGQDYS
jgi:PBSX family phage terminase large subunit